MKKCITCNIEKDVNSFYKDKKFKDGYKSKCKECYKPYLKKYYKDNKEKIIEKICKPYKQKYNEFYYQNNKDKILKRNKEYFQNTKEQRRLYQINYRAKNKETLYKKEKIRYDLDINYRLKRILRARLGASIKNNQKIGSAVNDLGCSIEKFKIYIENLFEDSMSWGNWSRAGWHIDHKIALAKFNLTNREELLKACHYTNLQPMWAEDNLSKGAK